MDNFSKVDQLDNFEICLVCLGFANKITVHILTPLRSNSQIKFIANLDDNCLTLDGKKIQRGGRLTVTFIDDAHLALGLVAYKTFHSTTFISVNDTTNYQHTSNSQ